MRRRISHTLHQLSARGARRSIAISAMMLNSAVDRRGDADRRIAGRDHHQGRADHYEPDRQGQPRLAAGAVGIGADLRPTLACYHVAAFLMAAFHVADLM